MMAQTVKINFRRKKIKSCFPAQERSQFSFPFRALISFVLLFFVFVFALNPIVTSKIFLVFGTGALNALRLFYFRIFLKTDTSLRTHFTPDNADENVKHFISMFLKRRNIILINI